MALTASGLPVVSRADSVAGPRQGSWTYADYAALPNDGKHYEIINGVLYVMPGPNALHQRTLWRFIRHLDDHVVVPGLGEAFAAPFDVELGPGDIVQPDLSVVLKANLAKIIDSRILGAPDLVIEISSPSTATYDRSTKLEAYERAGVQEYWIADGAAKTIELLVLDQGRYRSLGVFQGQARLPSRVLPNLPVPVEQFFT